YWVRFAHGGTTYESAVANSLALIRAAEEAGVERIVHVSITNPDEESTLGYFRGKARVERAIRESTLSHAILRPAVLFGDEGILTREEVDGLLADLLVTNSAPTGETKLSEWMAAHRDSLGRRYQSELARHF